MSASQWELPVSIQSYSYTYATKHTILQAPTQVSGRRDRPCSSEWSTRPVVQGSSCRAFLQNINKTQNKQLDKTRAVPSTQAAENLSKTLKLSLLYPVLTLTT